MQPSFVNILKGSALTVFAIGGFSPLLVAHYNLLLDSAGHRGIWSSVVYMILGLSFICLSLLWFVCSVKIAQIVIYKFSGCKFPLPVIGASAVASLGFISALLYLFIPWELVLLLGLILGTLGLTLILYMEEQYKLSNRILPDREAGRSAAEAGPATFIDWTEIGS